MAEFGKDESVLQRVSAATLGGVARELTGSSARPENTGISRLRGFGPMTRISTSFGELPAQALRVRDQVRTRNGGFKAVQMGRQGRSGYRFSATSSGGAADHHSCRVIGASVAGCGYHPGAAPPMARASSFTASP